MDTNTSGQGQNATVPAEIDRWNWGAFLLNWIWGIGNNTFIALLMFVPFANIIVLFLLGAKGSAWAWRNKRWDSVAHFKRVQRQWAKWGVLVLVGGIVAMAALMFTIASALKTSEPYKLATSRLQGNPQVLTMVGAPMVTGAPMGKIEVSGPSGHASLSFSVEGPKGKGEAYVEAVKDLGKWQINRMAFEDETTGQRVDLSAEAGRGI